MAERRRRECLCRDLLARPNFVRGQGEGSCGGTASRLRRACPCGTPAPRVKVERLTSRTTLTGGAGVWRPVVRDRGAAQRGRPPGAPAGGTPVRATTG